MSLDYGTIAELKESIITKYPNMARNPTFRAGKYGDLVEMNEADIDVTIRGFIAIILLIATIGIVVWQLYVGNFAARWWIPALTLAGTIVAFFFYSDAAKTVESLKAGWYPE